MLSSAATLLTLDSLASMRRYRFKSRLLNSTSFAGRALRSSINISFPLLLRTTRRISIARSRSRYSLAGTLPNSTSHLYGYLPRRPLAEPVRITPSVCGIAESFGRSAAGETPVGVTAAITVANVRNLRTVYQNSMLVSIEDYRMREVKPQHKKASYEMKTAHGLVRS